MEDEKVFFYKGEDYKIKTSENDNFGIKVVLENKYPKKNIEITRKNQIIPKEIGDVGLLSISDKDLINSLIRNGIIRTTDYNMARFSLRRLFDFDEKGVLSHMCGSGREREALECR